MVAFGGMQKVASTPVAGFALQNGTPAIISWTAPNDGQLHRFMVFAGMHVTTAMTGGQCKTSFETPDGNTGALTHYNGGEGAGGTYGSADGGNCQTAVCKAGSTVTFEQTSALTLGAATVWAEIWAS